MHALAVAGVAAAILLLVAAGRAWSGTARERWLVWGLAGSILLLRAGVFAWHLVPARFSVAHSLPLQICDLGAVCSALALVSTRRGLMAIAYFWGLALSIQALMQPDLAAGPGSVAFWTFWLHHALIVGVAVYLVAVRGYRPSAADLRLAILAGVAYVAVVLPVDIMLDANYGYVGRGRAAQPTLLDVLGPWPWRVGAMLALGAVVMALLWLPWRHATARSGPLPPAASSR